MRIDPRIFNTALLHARFISWTEAFPEVITRFHRKLYAAFHNIYEAVYQFSLLLQYLAHFMVYPSDSEGDRGGGWGAGQRF